MREVFLPLTLDDLWETVFEYPQAMLYAGGTDLLVRQKMHNYNCNLTQNHNAGSPGKISSDLCYNPLICLERIQELKEIYKQDGMIFIGSCVSHARLLESALIKRHFPVLIHALKVLGSPQVRNMGTIGGNICTASPAGDTLPPLYVLKAVLEIRSIDSKRFVPLKHFIKNPGETALQEYEILYGIWIKSNQDFNLHHYEKVGQRKALAIAIASLAAVLRLSDAGIIEDARFAWGSAGPKVVYSKKIDRALIGKPLTEESLKSVIPLIREAVSPIDDIRASAQYRRAVSGNLIFRLLQSGNNVKN